MVLLDAELERGPSVGTGPIDVCAPFDQFLDYEVIPLETRTVEGIPSRCSVLVEDITKVFIFTLEIIKILRLGHFLRSANFGS